MTALLLAVSLVLHSVVAQDSPPKITEPESSITHILHEGARMDLECRATGAPTPVYRWKKNGQPVTEDSVTTVNSTSGTLTISSFTSSEEGRYQCFAENTISNSVIAAMSKVITLKKVYLNTTWTVAESTVSKVEGEYAKLVCSNPPNSVPVGTFKWYVTVDDTAEGDVESNTRIYTDAEGSLHFAYVLTSDDVSSASKKYKCGIMNSAMSIIKLGSVKNLAITDLDTVPDREPVNQYVTNPARAMVGSDAILECIFSGKPIPTITWHKQGNTAAITPSEKYKFDNNNRRMIVTNVQEPDEGSFKCKGSSTGGSDEATIYLDVIGGPVMLESLSRMTIPAGRNARLPCRARALHGETALAQPVWFKNGASLPVQNTGKLQFSDSGKVLTVQNVSKPADIACYQCNVSNVHGYEFRDGCLNVIDPITVLTRPPATQEITKGDIVNLTVIAQTDEAFNLTYRWIFKNTTYTDVTPNMLPHATINTTSMEAYINTSALSTEEYNTINGTYYRFMYHDHENYTVAIQVVLSEIAGTGTVATAAVDLWWIALIVAIIILLIVIVCIVCICNRKRQEGTYPLDKKERANDLDPEKDLADSGFHDLSRAPGDDDYPGKPSKLNPNFDYGDDIDDEDDQSLMEYGGGDFDTSKFNEEGSFIGQYSNKQKQQEVQHSPVPLNHNTTESQI